MQAKYTPGPWSVDVHQNIMCGGKLVAFPGIYNGLPQEANAQLIAAAPDMAEALMSLLRVKDFIDGCDADSSRDLLAAIRQAEEATKKAGL